MSRELQATLPTPARPCQCRPRAQSTDKKNPQPRPLAPYSAASPGTLNDVAGRASTGWGVRRSGVIPAELVDFARAILRSILYVIHSKAVSPISLLAQIQDSVPGSSNTRPLNMKQIETGVSNRLHNRPAVFCRWIRIRPLQGAAIRPTQSQIRRFDQVLCCRIIGDKRLKEVDLGRVDVATDLDLVFKDKGDMAAGPISAVEGGNVCVENKMAGPSNQILDKRTNDRWVEVLHIGVWQSSARIGTPPV